MRFYQKSKTICALTIFVALNVTDGHIGDNRQGRMALHAELPSSKAKREQALRNILSARRRQLLSSRVSSDLPKSWSPSPRKSRPVLAVSKDPLDMLEVQETRHGVYVTAPIGDEVAVIMENDEDDIVDLEFIKSVSTTSSNMEKIARSLDEVDQSTKNSLLIRINDTSTWLTSGAKFNDTNTPKNASKILLRSQKTLEHDNRRKNTVAMPESLYNHFRPVESNIPVEDMTQFLYFGQKIQPESSTTNNSVLDTTSTSSSVPSSRRRYSMKRFSTTTPIPVPRLEEIINEEMNIAVERSTIERNKIPKTKNVFRSPGTGTYFRKSPIRTSDPTIVTNVIMTRESGRNASVGLDEKRESTLLRNSGKSQSDPSAHAHRDQVLIGGDRDRGSNAHTDTATAHRSGNATTENAADSTQFQKDAEVAKKEKRHQRKDILLSPIHQNSNDDSSEQSTIIKAIDIIASRSSVITEDTTMEMASTSTYELTNEKTNKITTWQSVHSNKEDSTTSAPKIDIDPRMTSSTINDLAGTLEPKSPPIIPTTTIASHSSLRIVVTEPMSYETGIESVTISNRDEEPEAEEAMVKVDTVNQADSRKDRTRPRINRTDPIAVPYTRSNTGKTTVVESTLPSSVPIEPEFLITETTTEKLEHKHAYAYEITNVTRLLRNYTGPGLSVAVDHQVKVDKSKKNEDETDEEDNKKNTSSKKHKKLEEQEQRVVEKEKETEEDSTLTRTNVGSIHEIRNGGGSTQPTPQQQQPLPLLLPTLQRASSGSSSGGIVELARTPGELSAGTNVGEATANSTSSWNTSTGGTPIITSASSNSSASNISNSHSSTSSGSQTSSSSSSSSSSASSHSSGHLVGERGRKGGYGARQQYHHQNRGGGAGAESTVSSGGSSIGTRNTLPSAATPVTTTEVSGASTARVDQDNAQTIALPNHDRNRNDAVTENILVTSTLRWNHTGSNKVSSGVERSEVYGGDRRYLRKSASAVLNQRTSEEGLLKEVKRRRGSLSSGSVASFSNSRRLKGSRSGAIEESRTSGSRSMENRTVVVENGDGQSITNQTTRVKDVHNESHDKFSEVREGMTQMQREVTVGPSEDMTVVPKLDEVEKIPETTVGSILAPSSTLAAPVKSLSLERDQDEVETVNRFNLTDQVTASSAASAVVTSENPKHLSEPVTTSVTSTLNTVQKSATTVARPVFPVTPKMLKEHTKTGNNDEISEVDSAKTAEASRPFGLAKDLDPSEIQKMYRSQTTLKPDAAMTTIAPEVERSTDINEDPVTSSPAKEQPSTMIPVNSSVTRKPVSVERSPEVRGRNLADKTKDKDDVLPIMQLYNTSNIFNGTGKDTQEAVNGVRTLELPGVIEVNATRQEADPELAGTTTHEPEVSESPTKERTRTGQKNSGDISGIGEARPGGTGIPKKSRHGGSREEMHDSVGPPRGSNHSNPGNSYSAGGAQVNMTRHRPSYYYTPPPEFVGYRPEFNGSFFENGMISVSPRESVNISEVITKRHDGDTIATQETVAVVSYILATLVVFPIAVGVGLILRRLIIRNRKVRIYTPR